MPIKLTLVDEIPDLPPKRDLKAYVAGAEDNPGKWVAIPGTEGPADNTASHLRHTYGDRVEVAVRQRVVYIRAKAEK
ncbi:MAG: hypothetical protein ABSF89_06525 [Acidimicrobiales bacterium]|jgi:hypothetical protein